MSDNIAMQENKPMEEPIAIVGMGCRFPGGVNDTESFWQLLINQVDAITQMPSGRFNMDHYYDPALSTSGKIITREGGFLSGVDQFDAEFFNVSAYEAIYLDPQQRLLFEVTWEALESGGLVPAKLAGSNTGVFVGMWLNDYEDMIYGASDNVDLQITLGAGRYPASGRLSYLFDFRGPSMTLDTACSSGLVSVHLACQSLRSGESDMALAGAANVILQPQISIAYSRAGMLSPEGRCKFGDALANGYVRSDGAAVLILKRLSDAVRDGDMIRGLIRGSAINNDGHAGDSLVTPSPLGQIEMLREAYRAAGVNPAQVGYIEAHGTGTRIGDPIELEAIAAVLSEGRASDTPCWVGSVKTNIGHTESVSGIAGLIKAVLSLEHGVIPASLHFHTPNPIVPWSDIPLKIPTQVTAWPVSVESRYAGVSSFGVTGTNAHVVLEAAPPQNIPSVSASDQIQHYILPISAHKPEALTELANEYRTLLSDGANLLKDVGYSASQYRTHHDYRAAFVGQSAAEIVEQITDWTGTATVASPRKIVFVFPGQGGQWLGMGRQFVEAEPAFRSMIERCEKAMQPYLDFSLAAVLSASQTEIDLEDIQVIQPAIFAVQVALAELWRSKGVEPDAVIGHSMGEVAAAYTTGILSLEDAAKVICLRSQLMRRVSGLGTMAVVELSLAEAQTALTGYEDKLSVAVNNAPRSVVISGDLNALDEVINQLQEHDVFCRKVKVDVAAHSPHMDGLRPELVATLSGMVAKNESVPIYSTVTGALQAGREFDSEYWGHNLREPVLFSAAVQEALRDGCNTFIEIGPHPVLLPAIERGLNDYDFDHDSEANIALIESMRRDEDQLKVMAEAVAKLYRAGYVLDWKQIYPAGEFVSLPRYPWQRERYWVDIDPTLVVTRSVQSTSLEARTDWLYQPTWEPVELPTSEPIDGTWLIFADHKGIGDVLAQQLQDGERSIMVLRHAGNDATGETNQISINPTQAEDFRHLLTQVPEELRGVVYLWGVDMPNGVDMSIHELTVAQHEVLGGLLHLTQALIESRRTAPIWIVTQGTQGIVDSVDGHLAPAQAALWGLGRVIREEQPDLWGGLIDLDPDSDVDAAQTIWNELGANDGEDQLAYRAGQRYALRLTNVALPQSAQPYRFRPDGTYLITGGLGDIGLHLAKWMLEQGARRFILMGRTELPPRSQWRATAANHPLKAKIEAVRELEALGASVHIAAVDVADETQLRAYLDTFDQDGWPSIVGVIHAAGVSDDYLVAKLTDEALMKVLQPKVMGGWLLHKLLRDVELFVLFSSINGLLGLPGQANYAAANTFLDGLAAYRRSIGLHAISIDWGVWSNLGLALKEGGQVTASHLAEMGVNSFTTEEGFAALATLLSFNPVQAVVVPADWAQYTESRAARHFPLFTHVLHKPENASSKVVAGTAISNQLLAAPLDTRRDVLETYLKEAIAPILRVSSTKIKVNEPLGSYGMNSLMGMELRNRLERDLGITLSATLVWNYPTVELMSTFLATKLGMSLVAETAAMVSSDHQTGEEAPLETLMADLATLSDDDILRELMDKS